MRFLFVDRIVQLSPAECVRGVLRITSHNDYLCYDNQGTLCFMPSLIGEALGQLAAWNVMFHNDFRLRPVAGIASSAKPFRPVYVGETLLLESFIDTLDDTAVEYHSVARVGDEVVFTIDGALGPLLPMLDFIDQAEVRQQFADIYHPGDWPPIQVPEAKLFDAVPSRLPMVFDRIIECEPGVRLLAEKTILPDAPYFSDHFPNKPVLPMTVLLECQLNLAREFIARSTFSALYKVGEVRKVKMNGFVQPGDVVLCYLKVKHHDEHELILNYRSEVNGKRVCVLDIVMIGV